MKRKELIKLIDDLLYKYRTSFGVDIRQKVGEYVDEYLSILLGEEQHFSFDDKEPELNAYVSLVWEDGSNCECIYTGLVMTILPLPTHWYYVKSLPDEVEKIPAKVYKAWIGSNHKLTYVFGYFEDKEEAEKCIANYSHTASDPPKGIDEITIIRKSN